MLQNDPAVLFDDFISHPDKYEPEAAELIQLLVSGQREVDDLDPDERQVLDRATVDFSTPYRPKKDSLPTTPSRAPDSPPPLPMEFEDDDIPLAPNPMGAFWWL